MTKKQLTGKWHTNLSSDSLKQGDTVLFQKEGYIDLDFKFNHDIRQHLWYAKCGNKFFLDYFIPTPPDYETVGHWDLSTTDDKTVLKLVIRHKTMTLLFISGDEKRMQFIIQDIKYN